MIESERSKKKNGEKSMRAPEIFPSSSSLLFSLSLFKKKQDHEPRRCPRPRARRRLAHWCRRRGRPTQRYVVAEALERGRT